MKNKYILFTGLFISLLLFTGCATTVKIPVVGSTPAGFTKVMENRRKVALIFKNNARVPHEWMQIMEGAVRNEIRNARYFTVVDTDTRKTRLGEIAFSSSGITGEQKELGLELSADAFLVITIPRAPSSQCGQDIKYKTETICLEKRQDKCVKEREIQRQIVTGYRTTTTPVNGQLVRVETGKSLDYAFLEPVKTDNTEGNPACPPQSLGITEAMTEAAGKLVSNLSPYMTDIKVPLKTDPEGSSESKEDLVKDHLKKGLKYLELDEPDYEQAHSEWMAAYNASDRRNPSAAWNLAVLAWKKGDYEEASRFFTEATKLGGEEWMDDDIIELVSKFRKEKNLQE